MYVFNQTVKLREMSMESCHAPMTDERVKTWQNYLIHRAKMKALE